MGSILLVHQNHSEAIRFHRVAFNMTRNVEFGAAGLFLGRNGRFHRGLKSMLMGNRFRYISDFAGEHFMIEGLYKLSGDLVNIDKLEPG